MNGWSRDVLSRRHQVVQRVLPMQLLVDTDLSTMADCCSVALGFGGVTHGDSDGEPICSGSSGINRKRNRTKDGLGGITHGVSNGEIISGANVGEKRRSPRCRSGATIGFGGMAHRDGNGETNSSVDGDGVDSILLMAVETMGDDQ
jgi:hypothetical protein